MKKFLLVLACLFLTSFSRAAWFGSGGPVDYAQDAGNEFYCATSTFVVTQPGVSISSPTISLYNPIGSGKNLTVLEVTPAFAASPAAPVTFFLAYNVTPSSGVQSGTGSAGPIISANLVEKSTGTLTTAVAKCNVQGILPAAPLAFRYLSGVMGATPISGYNAADQTQGKLVIPPGGLVSLQTTNSASVLASILWREDPL